MAPCLADKRVALVIGNGAYKNTAALTNPPNDAAGRADPRSAGVRKRRPGTRPANPDHPITLTLGFAASEADRELVERLTVLTGARSISEAIRGAIRNEWRVNSPPKALAPISPALVSS